MCRFVNVMGRLPELGSGLLAQKAIMETSQFLSGHWVPQCRYHTC